MLFIHGSAAKHFQQTIRRLWRNGGHRHGRLTLPSEGLRTRIRNLWRFRYGVRLGARLDAASVGTICRDLAPRVPGVWDFALGRLQSRLPWLRSSLDDTSVSQPGSWEGAMGGVSLSRASEPNESSYEACWAEDLAGL